MSQVRRVFIHPGSVTSWYDGQSHFISAPILAQLYGVIFKDCYVVDKRAETKVGYIRQDDDLHLYPRRDGRYTPANKIIARK